MWWWQNIWDLFQCLLYLLYFCLYQYLLTKRRKVQIGDTIEFSLLPDLKEKILTEVSELYRADTFKELFEKLFDNKEEIEKKVKGMYEIYSPEQEKEYGVLGMRIKLL